jgi:hypothetical protein
MSPSTPQPRSRCTVPQDPPLVWISYADPAHPSSVAFSDWLDSLPFVVRQSVEASIEALRDLAARGGITVSDDRSFAPVSSFPLMYELKWHLNVKGKHVEIRQYHGEPPDLPGHLVELHTHIKLTSGSKAEQKVKQNQEMSQAQLRSMAGRASLWGTR